MFITIPTTEYTSTVEGSVVRTVECEACFFRYQYLLHRTATGRDAAVFLFSRARRQAQDKAQKELHRKLDTEHDDVPCPQCRHRQSKHLAHARAIAYPGLKNLGGAFLLLAAVIGGLMLAVLGVKLYSGRPMPAAEDTYVCGIILAVVAVPGLLLRGLRSLLLGTSAI